MNCDICSEQIIVCVLLTSETWEQIALDDYALCHLCIDKRLTEVGIKVHDAEVQLIGLQSLRSSPTTRTVKSGGWRSKEAALAGPIGLPNLYTRSI